MSITALLWELLCCAAIGASINPLFGALGEAFS